ncbi:hypothetical protein ACTPEF_25950, partial [Clostridioides difficile]
TLVLLIDNFLMTVVLTWGAHIADRYAEEGNIEGVERVQLLFGFGGNRKNPVIDTYKKCSNDTKCQKRFVAPR